MKSTAAAVRRDLRNAITPGKAAGLARFFKTGPGEYAEGDRFIGTMVPQQRAIARRYCDLPFAEVTKLLRSPWHEERAVALMILVTQFRRCDEPRRKSIYSLYLRSTRHINNWDLVDCSAEHIVGAWLAAHSTAERRRVLDRLARSGSLWERRIAVLATFHFIRQRDYRDTLRIAAMLLRDKHDLIHKATGWLLREVGNRDLAAEEAFLRKHAPRMPRTMLRYAIEKFPERKRQAYLRM